MTTRTPGTEIKVFVSVSSMKCLFLEGNSWRMLYYEF